MSTSAPVPLHEIIVVTPLGFSDRKSLYEQCIQLRIEVFVHEQGYPLELEEDELDPTATHLLLRLSPSGTPIGTIRLFKPEGSPYYKLGRLVVLKEYRKFRLGKELVQAAHRFAIEDHKKAGLDGPAVIVLHSQSYAVGFYAKSGYIAEGEEFDEDGAPHRRMRVKLEIPPDGA